MTSPARLWLFFRCLRWALMVAAVVYNIEFILHRSDHLNSFGQLSDATAFWMFGLPLAFIFTGFFELMMRDRAGLPRPAFGRDWRPRA